MTGIELRKEREARGMSQGEFAEWIGVGERTLRRAEAAKAATVPASVAAGVAASLAGMGAPGTANAARLTGQPARGDRTESGQPDTAIGQEDRTSYVPILEASIVEELRKRIEVLEGQVAEQDERLAEIGARSMVWPGSGNPKMGEGSGSTMKPLREMFGETARAMLKGDAYSQEMPDYEDESQEWRRGRR